MNQNLNLPHGRECLETPGCPWRTDGEPACVDAWGEAPCVQEEEEDEDEEMRENRAGEIIVLSPQLVALYAAQHPGEALRPFTSEDEDPLGCRICGRPWDDPEAETCDGDCLQGTGTTAYVVVPAD